MSKVVNSIFTSITLGLYVKVTKITSNFFLGIVYRGHSVVNSEMMNFRFRWIQDL